MFPIFSHFSVFLLCQIRASAARSFRSVASASSRAACSFRSSSRSCNASSLQDTSRYVRYHMYQLTLTEYWRSARAFFCIYWPALQYRYFPCAIFFLSMIFPNSAWEGLTADPIMFLTSWRPGQVAGWFMQRKYTTIC